MRLKTTSSIDFFIAFNALTLRKATVNSRIFFLKMRNCAAFVAEEGFHLCSCEFSAFFLFLIVPCL